MADSDKNIKIVPSTGQTTEPKIEYTGADNNTITQYVLDSGTVSYEGSAGQLFSVTDDLSDDIYSVNDLSGVPSIQVKDNGSVINNAYNGNLLVGTTIDNDSDKVQAYGSMSILGESGMLFHVDEDMDGEIFAVNDKSGIPSITVDEDGHVRTNEFSGDFVVGGSRRSPLIAHERGQIQGSVSGRYTSLNDNNWHTIGYLYRAQSSPLVIRAMCGHNSNGTYDDFVNDTYAYNIADGTVVTIGNTSTGSTYTMQLRKIKRSNITLSDGTIVVGGGDGGWEYQIARNQGYGMTVFINIMGAPSDWTWVV